MNAIQLLEEQHQKAKAAFGKLLAAAPAQRGDLWKALQPELKGHEEIEDTCLYGPLAEEHPLGHQAGGVDLRSTRRGSQRGREAHRDD